VVVVRLPARVVAAHETQGTAARRAVRPRRSPATIAPPCPGGRQPLPGPPSAAAAVVVDVDVVVLLVVLVVVLVVGAVVVVVD
jgi:hypothetical protein